MFLAEHQKAKHHCYKRYHLREECNALIPCRLLSPPIDIEADQIAFQQKRPSPDVGLEFTGRPLHVYIH